MTTRDGIDLCIEAVTRRRKAMLRILDSEEIHGDRDSVSVAKRRLHDHDAILTDLAKIRQEAGDA